MCGGSGGWSSETSTTSGDQRGSSSSGAAQSLEAFTADGKEEPDCVVSETTRLESTDPEVLADAYVDDIYPIHIQDGRPCVVDDDNRIIGSITDSLGQLLRDCIELGNDYRAEILDIEGRECNISISNKCLISDHAVLASVNPEPLSDLSEGNRLQVRLYDDSLCVIDDSERIIGAISEPWTRMIIECLESGFEYQAEVTELDGGHCEVFVTKIEPDE